jgi:hypothetical protein
MLMLLFLIVFRARVASIAKKTEKRLVTDLRRARIVRDLLEGRVGMTAT